MKYRITAADLLSLIVRPTLRWLGEKYATHEAEVLLIAIAIQESRLAARRQQPSGPARSYWQIEPQTAKAVYLKWGTGQRALDKLGLRPVTLLIAKEQMEWSEVGSCIIARGILYLDSKPLPWVGNEDAAWDYYANRTWRPGKPRHNAWQQSYSTAMDAVALAE